MLSMRLKNDLLVDEYELILIRRDDGFDLRLITRDNLLWWFILNFNLSLDAKPHSFIPW